MAEEVLAQKENGNRVWGRDLTVQLGDWVGKSSVDWNISLMLSVVVTHTKTNLMLSQVGEIRLNFTVTSFAFARETFQQGICGGLWEKCQKHCLYKFSFDKGIYIICIHTCTHM